MKWEYWMLICIYPEQFVAECNRLGEMGWEMISSWGGQGNYSATFKRSLKAKITKE